MKFLAFAAAAAMMTIGSAQAAEINFDTNVAANPFTGIYSQNGFNVTYAAGGLRLINNNGNFGDVLAGINAAGGSFDLTRAGGGLFSIQGFQGGSGLANTTVTYSLLGYLSGATTYSQTLTATGTTPRTANLFIFNPAPAVNRFDRITFSMQSSQSSPLIDNINVTEIAAPTPDPLPPVAGVPEPATWAMLILGFGFVGSAMRRRSVACPAAAHC